MSKRKKQPKAMNTKAVRRLLQELPDKSAQYYGLDAPELPASVVPENAAGMALDCNSTLGNFGAGCFFNTGFIGYPRLAELAQISE